jgi:hypothetical protein
MSVSAPVLFVKEPVLQLLLCLHNDDLNRDARSERCTVVKHVANFTRTYPARMSQTTGLEFEATCDADDGWAAEGFSELEALLDGSTEPLADGRYLLNMTVKLALPGERLSGTCQTRIYTSQDAFIVQVSIDRQGLWRGALGDGYRMLGGVFDASLTAGSDSRAWYGASLTYWAMADDGCEVTAYVDDALALVGRPPHPTLASGSQSLRKTRIDHGVLWHGAANLPRTPRLSHDAWVLLSPNLPFETQERINARFFAPEAPHVRACINQLRFRHYQRELEDDRPDLLREEQKLDDEGLALLRTIEAHSRLDAPLITEEFQHEVHQVANRLAWFRSHVSELKRTRRTLHIARRNYVIHAASIVNDGAQLEILGSDSHESAAVRLLTQWKKAPDGGDENLLADFGEMREVCDQLSTDLEYSDEAIERNRAMLQSSTEQLQMAEHHHLKEISHHMSIDSAAVVASLAAFVAVEALVKPLDLDHSIFGLGLVLCVASLAFSVLVWKAKGPNPKTLLERGSIVVTFGVIAATLASALALAPMTGTESPRVLSDEAMRVLRFDYVEYVAAALLAMGVIYKLIWRKR